MSLKDRSFPDWTVILLIVVASFVGAVIVRKEPFMDSCLIPGTKPVLPHRFSDCEMLAPADTGDRRPRPVDPYCDAFDIVWGPVTHFVCLPEK